MALTGVLWSIASWRLIYHYTGIMCCKKEGTHLVEGMTIKRTFHLFLWITMFIEALGYMNLADFIELNPDDIKREKIGYALNDIIGRGLLEFITFAVATSLWFQQTAQARAFVSERNPIFRIAPLLLLLISIGLLVCAIVELVSLLGKDSDASEDLAHYKTRSKAHKWQLLMESCAWGINMILVLVCGYMIHMRIANLPTYAQVGSHARRNIITKMMFPMAFCALAYLLRSFWMLVDFLSIVYQPKVEFEMGERWWIGNMWIPTAIASIMTLYSIRKRDRSPDAIEGEENDSLIPAAKPPAEAFLSFHKMVGDDNLDHQEDCEEDTFI